MLIFATMLAGLWCGLLYRYHEVFWPTDLFMTLLACTMAWLVFPQVLLCWLVSGVAWYLPIRFDSMRIRLGAAGASALIWFGTVAWAIPDINLH